MNNDACDEDGHQTVQQSGGRCVYCGEQVEQPPQEFDLQQGHVDLSDD